MGFYLLPSRKIDSSDGFQFFYFYFGIRSVGGGRCKDPNYKEPKECIPEGNQNHLALR